MKKPVDPDLIRFAAGAYLQSGPDMPSSPLTREEFASLREGDKGLLHRIAAEHKLRLIELDYPEEIGGGIRLASHGRMRIAEGETNKKWQDFETFSFGDSPQLADELLALVLSGRKRATCWAASQGLMSVEVSKSMVVLDGLGIPKAILRTIELTKRRFDDVDAEFAFDEGEGDLSLEFWRSAHTRYFTRLGLFAPDMVLWCERFELLERI